ncbi:hypothetical protein [Paenibacillus thalictri]|uniref:Uncharacterized protein n=1 Tax=Paenibacillus thalictri TaxID=2527873 RepID=A0A4V2J304_9BACL|nr:hypothetical protein [Paenibacillus thalictri]TBL68368.1 hypothetical protein EYB31_38295 [Paenibacillus thalictri]
MELFNNNHLIHKLAFSCEMRPMIGSENEKVIGPGKAFEIEAAVADVCLVSSVARNHSIERPVVRIVVDEWSRMIVGLEVR